MIHSLTNIHLHSITGTYFPANSDQRFQSRFNCPNGFSTSSADPQGLGEQRGENITYPFAAMRKPVEALRVVSNEFLHETRAPLRRRWQPRLFSRRFNSPSRFSRASSWEPEVAFLLAGHSSRTGASNPFRIGRCSDDIQVNVKEKESEILVSISSRWLAWVRFFFRSRTSRFSSRRKERRPAAMQNARMRRIVKYLDPTWGTHYFAGVHLGTREHREDLQSLPFTPLLLLWPHPRVSLAKKSRFPLLPTILRSVELFLIASTRSASADRGLANHSPLNFNLPI